MPEFLAALATTIAVPIVGALVAIIFGRFGISGRIRQMELVEKKLAVYDKLRATEGVDAGVIDNFRREIEHLLRATITAPEDADDEFEPMGDVQGPRRGPKPFNDFSWLRRWIFLPFPSTFFGFVGGAIYYYFLLVWLSLGIANPIIALSENGATGETFGLIVFFIIIAIGGQSIARAIVVRSYRKYVRDEQFRYMVQGQGLAAYSSASSPSP